MKSQKNEKLINISNARQGIYQDAIKKIGEDKVCPFCNENLTKYHKRPILKEDKNWIVTENMYPYKGARVHLIFINKKHLENLSDIPTEAWIELLKLFRTFSKKYKSPGGTLMMRFGVTDYTGASVSHLHAHLISGDPNDPNREPVITRVA